MKKILSLVLALMLLFSVLPAAVAEDNLTRAAAAVMLDDLFALADMHPSNIPEFETTPRNLGYTASNGAILSANVVAAAKDCVSYETQPQIEAVINAGLMGLDSDNLSFRPSKPVTAREFALSIALGLYGADLAVDHLALAVADGVFTQEQLTDDVLTVEAAQAMVDAVAARLQIVAVFATADIHGNYIPYTAADGNFQIGSVARIKTIMDEVRAEIGEDCVLYVDGGDSPYNTTLANITLGDVSVAALGALGLDATVLGNHDFDYTFENLLRLAEAADYDMLSANTKYKEGHQPEGMATLTGGIYFELNDASELPKYFSQVLADQTGASLTSEKMQAEKLDDGRWQVVIDVPNRSVQECNIMIPTIGLSDITITVFDQHEITVRNCILILIAIVALIIVCRILRAITRPKFRNVKLEVFVNNISQKSWSLNTSIKKKSMRGYVPVGFQFTCNMGGALEIRPARDGAQIILKNKALLNGATIKVGNTQLDKTKKAVLKRNNGVLTATVNNETMSWKLVSVYQNTTYRNKAAKPAASTRKPSGRSSVPNRY